MIIHPVCKSEQITNRTNEKLNEEIKYILNEFEEDNITIYLENNCKIKPFFYSTEQVSAILNDNPKLEFLLDIAHVDNIEHLKRLISTKIPKMLHVADRRKEVEHEHVGIGKGDIDYDQIFGKILKTYNGMIDIESIATNEDIKLSIECINKYYN